METQSLQMGRKSRFERIDPAVDGATTADCAITINRRGSNRTLLRNSLLALPAATLILCASQAAQVGINFQDNWWGIEYAPLTAPSAFGIPLQNWYNAPCVENSGWIPFSTNGSFALPLGGMIHVTWSCRNTYSQLAEIPEGGEDQVVYGYLDDWDGGYSVTLTGFRDFAASYAITTIASSDAALSFAAALVATDSGTDVLQYLDNYNVWYAWSDYPLAGTSTVSSARVTMVGNNKVRITGEPKNVATGMRSTLAGILIDYTPGGSNPPEMEIQPKSPSLRIYTGQSFTLNSQASGTPTLGYQWRKGGRIIAGATGTSYTKTGVNPADSGNYDVVVTNPFGSVTSAAATVTITLGPATKGPGQVSDGLMVWLRADSGISVSDGDRVTFWKDESGQENHAFYDTSGNWSGPQWGEQPPRFVGINPEVGNKPTVHFGGYNALGLNLTWLAGSDYTIFVVNSRDRFGEGNFYIGGQALAVNENLVLGYATENVLRQDHFGFPLDGLVEPAYLGEPIWEMDTFHFTQTGGRRLYQNGRLLAVDNFVQPLVANYGTTLGHTRSWSVDWMGYSWFKGDLAEVVVYNRALSWAERIRVEADLAARYSRTLSLDDYVPCDGWRNHGDYVSAHAYAVQVFVAAGLMTPAEGAHAQSKAAESDCSK